MIYHRPEGCTIRNGLNWHLGNCPMFIIKLGNFKWFLFFGSYKTQCGYHYTTKKERDAEEKFNLSVYGSKKAPFLTASSFHPVSSDNA